MTETNDGGSISLTAASWWTVDRSHEPRLTEGATPLVESCIRTHGWTEEFTLRVLEGYKQFLSFKQVFEDWNATKLSPPLPVDQMWHQHILDTKNYANDCDLLVGRFVHHDRDGGLDVEARRERVTSTQNAIRTLHGDTYDRQVWDFGLDGGDHAGRGNRRPRENEPAEASRAVRARSAQEVTHTVNPTDPSNGSDSFSFRINYLGKGTVPFRTTVTSPFSKFFRAYACLQRLDVNRTRFVCRYRAITCDDTPAQVNLQDGDTVVAYPLVDGKVSFCIKDHQSGEEAFVSTGRTAPFRPHFSSFASQHGIEDLSSLRFVLDGELVHGHQTPEMIRLETGDIIHVMREESAC